ncbi:hypothetical protein I553_2544 [Mycobacterium xenopi 4042]|uniref:Uncharacterized protein n=1 Tax=Mycobacterium xenopi 4042 TaxID=1299334 RepID=X8C7N1_MYCXE|nr:hypothetical protein I553_2544 [Mycobacterium xenopi 4042]
MLHRSRPSAWSPPVVSSGWSLSRASCPHPGTGSAWGPAPTCHVSRRARTLDPVLRRAALTGHRGFTLVAAAF